MKQRLMNNLGLKVAALLLATIMWLVVVNVNDPIEKKTYHDIPVRITHDELITNQGKTYRIQNESNKVNVTVTGKRSVLERIQAENIVATADVRDMELSTLLPIKISITGYEGNYRAAVPAPNNVEIKQEQSVPQRFPISVVSKGELLDGFVLDEFEPQPASLQITGPKSLIGRIDKVVAKVNISGISKDTVKEAELTLYDGGGTVLDQTSLTTNLGGEPGQQMRVKVKIKVLPTKVVPIKVDSSKIKPTIGYKVSEINVEPSSIHIAAKPSILEEITDIALPADAVKMENVSKKADITVDVAKYLPEDVRLANENEKNIVVTVSLERLGMKTFDVPVDSIKKNNLQKDLKVIFNENKEVEMNFTGEREALKKLTMEQIQEQAFIDLKEYTSEGTYKVPVQVNVREGCQLAEPVTVSVTLKKQG